MEPCMHHAEDNFVTRTVGEDDTLEATQDPSEYPLIMTYM